ncbi:MAG TPA: nucleotidyltransferase family protein [Stellaceae bacterium]|nr:nucleotidyltransferase family protein [Stellaceae bacterium]
MDKDKVIEMLRAHADELRRRGVRRAALFGSVARGTARVDSDIDILIELDPQAPIDLFAYAGIKQYITSLFPGRVDVIDRDALKLYLRKPAAADAPYAF